MLTSCNDKKLIKYQYKDSEIEINWFHYSHLTNTSSDFIEIKCGDSFLNIFESQYGLQKVSVENKRITISHLTFNGVKPIQKRTDKICGYEIEYREVTSHEMYIQSKKQNLTEFKNGRWIHEKDSLTGIEIKNGKWILFYKGLETDSLNIYDYKTKVGNSNFADSEPNTGEFLILTNNSDTLNYELLRYDEKIISLADLQRGIIYVYKSEK